MYILTCPVCNEKEDIIHYGNVFHCNNCNKTTHLGEMDFESIENLLQ